MDIKKIVDKVKKLVTVEQTFDHDEDYILALSQEFSLSADEIKMLLNSVLALICPPTDLHGILQGKRALLELLRQLCLHKDMEAAEEIFLTDLLTKWFGFIEKSPALKYNRKVNMTEHPVFIFYVVASGHYVNKKSPPITFIKNDVSPLFRFYCIRFFNGIKKVMSSNLVDGTECDYLRAFRYFFVYANEQKKYDEELLEKQHEDDDFLLELIKDAFRNYDKIEWGNVSDKAGHAATEYEKKLIRILIENEDIHSHAHGSPDTTTAYPYIRRPGLTDTTISGTRTDSDNDDDKFSTTRVTAASIFMNQLTHEDLDDEFIDHEELIHFDLLYDHSQSDTNDSKQDAIEKAVPRPPSLKHRWVDTLNLRSHMFFWEKNYDKLHHYSLIYSYIAESWNKF